MRNTSETFISPRLESAKHRLHGGLRALGLATVLYVGAEFVDAELEDASAGEEASFVEKYADDPLRGGAIVLGALGGGTAALGAMERWSQKDNEQST